MAVDKEASQGIAKVPKRSFRSEVFRSGIRTRPGQSGRLYTSQRALTHSATAPPVSW